MLENPTEMYFKIILIEEIIAVIIVLGLIGFTVFNTIADKIYEWKSKKNNNRR